jgi:hypothetical protein
MENNRKGCINRDKNGCKNIQKVFNHYTETGERPEKYRRDYQIQTNKSPQTASLPEAVKLGQAQDFLI